MILLNFSDSWLAFSYIFPDDGYFDPNYGCIFQKRILQNFSHCLTKFSYRQRKANSRLLTILSILSSRKIFPPFLKWCSYKRWRVVFLKSSKKSDSSAVLMYRQHKKRTCIVKHCPERIRKYYAIVWYRTNVDLRWNQLSSNFDRVIRGAQRIYRLKTNVNNLTICYSPVCLFQMAFDWKTKLLFV